VASGRIARRLEEERRPYRFGEPALWRARIAALSGERARAIALLRDALAQGMPHGLTLHRDQDLEVLRKEAAFRELLRPRG
jgi:hypothetical protein